MRLQSSRKIGITGVVIGSTTLALLSSSGVVVPVVGLSIPNSSSSSRNGGFSLERTRTQQQRQQEQGNHHHHQQQKLELSTQHATCQGKWWGCRRTLPILFSSKYDDDEGEFYDIDDSSSEDEKLREREFLERELAHLESLEELLLELEEQHVGSDDDDITNIDVDDDDDDDSDDDDGTLDDLLNMLPENYNPEQDDDDEEEELRSDASTTTTTTTTGSNIPATTLGTKTISSPFGSVFPAESLEDVLLQGVVPANAGVGSGSLAGDFDFDPLNLATKDYILQIQTYLLGLLPGDDDNAMDDEPRPPALILRDYREAEIRHGRLAMLAAIFWPLEEMLDRLLLDEDQFGPIIYGPITLPYFPLLMTLFMMSLGYLDIYAKAIKDRDEIGDAFLPGDCFWDPLRILEDAPASMKRNMQERELFNGRVAMLAFAVYLFEEATTRKPIISIEGNDLLFLPAYQIPFIQEWLDFQFSDIAL